MDLANLTRQSQVASKESQYLTTVERIATGK
jgi:hypothetical protein